MSGSPRVAAVAEIVPKLGRRKARHAGADGGPEFLPRPTARHPQDGLQLREAPLNRIQVGAVLREKTERRAPPDSDAPTDTAPAVFDGPIDGVSFLAYIEHVLAPTLCEAGHARSAASLCNTTTSPGQGRRVPAPVGGVVDHALAPLPTPVAANQIGPPATFIKKHEPRGIPGRGGLLPRRPGLCHRPAGRVRSRAPFFFRRQPSFVTARQIVGRLADVGNACCPLHQRPIRLLPDQDREPRQLRGQARRPPPRLAARRDLTRLAPPRLQAVDPRPDSPHTSPPPASTPCRRRCP